MKVSVSLPDDDVAFLDRYAETHGGTSRSAALHEAVKLLRAAELEADYADAWDEWVADGGAGWDAAASDGLA
ncbi:MAG: ribbon-helix-helix domain-containing protein [Actinomycetota bacterium]